ncbi:MAG: 50S ribosomal protein L11 methyltransferase [Oscillospiraceae bacterium]|jgi:ribosomal protein L11 methyltransferase|nr:50S ribosomal protein L11 methyltransferase [Oscillospiraceae bacterium]MBQ2597002.1 50S ribosomal protein L11 methyltransferase [Oscillospiraceae bacterium]
MQWLELTVDTASQGIELLEAELTINGFDSFIIDDEQDFHSFLENNRDYWDIVDESLEKSMDGVSRIRLYLTDGADAPEEVARLRALLAGLPAAFPDAKLGTLQLSFANVKDEDWENNWKQYYQPISIGKKLIVVPQWMKPDTEGRIPVLLDPGMIFGTGAHASTQMCMLRLEEHIRGGEQVLDLGSGSGILSITALLLGAAHATGVDVDPKAEDIARENAAINGLDNDRFTAVTGNVVTGQEALADLFSRTYDVICMNIFADVIIPMAAVLPRFMKQNTLVICSGVLETRYDEVRQAIEAAGLRITSLQAMNDWCCFTAVKGE